MDGATLRNTMLQVISEFSAEGFRMQSRVMLKEVFNRLQISDTDIEAQQMILTFWHDLIRNGYIAWGYDISNVDPPFCHLTEKGREALKHFSRDPANPSGYLEHLKQLAPLNAISQSYIQEALQTYNANCFKATAVMIGAAAERTILEARDTLVNYMSNAGLRVPGDLEDWRIKIVCDAMEEELDAHKSDMPRELREKFAAYWSAFAEQMRRVRNDAGHPESIDPVTPESVHAALLIFPELAKLANEIIDWAKTFYV